jgi:hypothetical protein
MLGIRYLLFAPCYEEGGEADHRLSKDLAKLTRSSYAAPVLLLAVRIAYTAVAMAIVISLLRAGNPVGGLLVVPAAAIWLRQAAEAKWSGRPVGR